MPFDWKALIDLARRLEQPAQDADDPEPYLRSALSRLYFGAYGYVRKHAEDFLQFNARGKPEDHGSLRRHLKGKLKGVGDRLHQLRLLRNDADYSDDLSSMDLETAVAEAITVAEWIFSALPPPKTS